MTAPLEDVLREMVRGIVREELASHAPAPATPRLYSVTQAAKYLSLSRALTYRLITSGELGSRKIRGRRLVSSAALAAFIDGDDGPSVPPPSSRTSS